uniref:Protein kinase domain-containing protein n=1 Tax=Chelydra serpentina TaxID=8475 RepID=A0A8C3S0D9_CHESE
MGAGLGPALSSSNPGAAGIRLGAGGELPIPQQARVWKYKLPCWAGSRSQCPRLVSPRGRFGMVYKLQEKATGKIRAGKYFRTRTPKEREAACREVELMNLLHHPRLVQCLARIPRTGCPSVPGSVAGGELFERMVDDDFELTEPTSIQYVRQILEGMQYVHRQSIVHLDLKPENIVCVSTSSHWVKIIDFGLARRLGEQEGPGWGVMHGTPEFVAPEVIAFEPVGFATDMWSIGVICYILLSGDSPFQGNSDMETLLSLPLPRGPSSSLLPFSQPKPVLMQLSLRSDPSRSLLRHRSIPHRPFPASGKQRLGTLSLPILANSH